MMMMRRLLLLALALHTGVGCSNTGVNQRISNLESEERQRRARLDELEVEIAAAEQKIAYAKADAEYQGCLATRAGIEADVVIEKANCLRQIAERSACLAKNESRTAKGAGLGCAAGWLAAIVTGGAAAPAVLLGCASGAVVSEASKQECGDVPRCGNIEEPTLLVLQRRGMVEVPHCVRPKPVPPPIADPGTATARGRERARANQCLQWRVERVEFSAPARKNSGEAWDPDGSAPDLEYSISSGNGRLYRSARFEAITLSETPQTALLVSAGQALTFELVDHDLISADRIAIFEIEVPETRQDEPISLVSGRTEARITLSCTSRP